MDEEKAVRHIYSASLKPVRHFIPLYDNGLVGQDVRVFYGIAPRCRVQLCWVILLLALHDLVHGVARPQSDEVGLHHAWLSLQDISMSPAHWMLKLKADQCMVEDDRCVSSATQLYMGTYAK